MSKLKVYTFDQIKDETLGPVGTPERDKYEAEIDLISRNWKKLIKNTGLSQKQLAKKMGISMGMVKKIVKDPFEVPVKVFLLFVQLFPDE